MKIYLTKSDMLVILAEHFRLEIIDVSATAMKKEYCLVTDELYWEGNEEK